MLTLTVILTPVESTGILARGIIHDETVFDNVYFQTADELARYAARTWYNKYAVRAVWAGERSAA